MIDLKRSTPLFISIIEGKVYDVNVLDELVVESRAIYALDRGYVDFRRFYTLHSDGGIYVTRAEKSMVFNVRESHLVDKNTGLKCN